MEMYIITDNEGVVTNVRMYDVPPDGAVKVPDQLMFKIVPGWLKQDDTYVSPIAVAIEAD